MVCIYHKFNKNCRRKSSDGRVNICLKCMTKYYPILLRLKHEKDM